MPLPQPTIKNGELEEKQKFISRCAGNPVMNKDFPDQKQRLATCYSLYERKKKKMAQEGKASVEWEECDCQAHFLI